MDDFNLTLHEVPKFYLRLKLYGNYEFPQNLHTKKSGELGYLCAVWYTAEAHLGPHQTYFGVTGNVYNLLTLFAKDQSKFASAHGIFICKILVCFFWAIDEFSSLNFFKNFQKLPKTSLRNSSCWYIM